MTTNKVNIRVELARNEKTGRLALTAIFNEKAPNFFKDKEGYYWIPTIEEKDFLNEAFQLMPVGQPTQKINKTTTFSKKPEPQRIEEEEPTSEIEEDLIETDITIERKLDKKIEKTPEEIPPLEEKEDTSVFEITEKEEDTEEEDEDEEEEKEDDDGLLVKADSDAIEAALEKRKQEKDTSMREADEQTIIDRVLSQKKKGKWSKK